MTADPTAKLNALTEELRVTTAVLRSDFSPEAIRQLTPAQRAVLRRELLRLREVSQRVASDIAAHLTGEAEYHPATREEIDAIVARHEPHDYGEDRGVHAPLPRDRGQA